MVKYLLEVTSNKQFNNNIQAKFFVKKMKFKELSTKILEVKSQM